MVYLTLAPVENFFKMNATETKVNKPGYEASTASKEFRVRITLSSRKVKSVEQGNNSVQSFFMTL